MRTPLWASQKVFLYRLLTLGCLGVFCCVLMVAAFPRRRVSGCFTPLERLLLLGLSALSVALFLSLGLMPMERSYTIYSLADMADHPERVYSAADVKEQFISGYIEKANESQKRLDEQTHIGNLEKTAEGGYRVTAKGRRLISLYRRLADLFPLPDEHSIYPNGRK